LPRLTAPALTVTAAVWASVPEPVTEPLIVFDWATVEENVAEKTPAALVVPEVDGANALPVPVEDSVTVLPPIPLPN